MATEENSEVAVRELVEARQMPRRVFQQLPAVGHDAALNYLGYVDGSAFYDFVAERQDGAIVRVEGLNVWEAIASKYKDCDGNVSDNCCSGDMANVKMEFHMFYSRLPRIAVTK